MPPTNSYAEPALLPDLQKLVRDLKADLLERIREHPEIDARVKADAYTPVEAGGRTAQAYEVWRDDYLEQVAVAWVLACVFVRYMEDNDLIAETYLAGITPDRRRQADDALAKYFQEHPRDSDREFLLNVFGKVGSIPAAKDLFAEGKTPLWAVGPSGDGAAKLLAFWRSVDPETGNLRRTFRADDGDTRFLGDLYQDLSESARKTYALLQTPGFVEEFILDHTLTPALDEFGLEAVRLIDPTCGSGHFLLGAFRRLFRLWNEREPGTDPTVLAQRALDAVYGVDVNPFAVSISRFRLVVEATHLCGLRRLNPAHGWAVHVATGDSLYHGSRHNRLGRIRDEQGYLPGMEPDPIYAIEDSGAVSGILGRQYHVVVGNPPYITVKDAKLNECYRERWGTCHRQYSLGVPFTERFFNLALASGGVLSGRPPQAGSEQGSRGRLPHKDAVGQPPPAGIQRLPHKDAVGQPPPAGIKQGNRGLFSENQVGQLPPAGMQKAARCYSPRILGQPPSAGTAIEQGSRGGRPTRRNKATGRACPTRLEWASRPRLARLGGPAAPGWLCHRTRRGGGCPTELGMSG
ncbi:MAG: BREX-2 system adenine-specific DNA-methyltransferase PglX [Isosphaeraceae bacterium]